MKHVARLMTIALCSMLVFTICTQDSITQEPQIDGVTLEQGLTMEQYVQESVLSYVPDGKLIARELTTDAGMAVYHN